MPRWKDRRQAQSGATLVELLVSMVIVSLALALIVGTLSTGILDSAIAKRNTAAQAIVQYEMESVSASVFSASAPSYSDCFATESPTRPATATGYQGACPSGAYSLRADVTWQWLPSAPSTVQVWTVAVTAWPSGATFGSSVSLFKINR
jgi:type II secretory pathway pseudopilin PulG